MNINRLTTLNNILNNNNILINNKKTHNQIQKFINISCHLVCHNFIHLFEIRVHRLSVPRVKYILMKYINNVFIHNIMNPVDQNIVSLINMCDIQKNINHNGIRLITKFFIENFLFHNKYNIGIILDTIARIIVFQLSRDLNML